MIAALVALGVVGLALLLSLVPLLGPEPRTTTDESVGELEARREELLRSLRDVELDHAMGKITDDDRDRLRAELEGRAVRVLAAIDDRSGPSERGA